MKFAGALEKIFVLRIGAGPAAFNVIDSQVVQFLGDHEFVIHGKRDGLSLSAISERCVEGEEFHIGPATAPLRSRLCCYFVLAASSWGTPTSFFFLRKVIISRSSRPTFSMGWSRAASRMARNLWRPVLFSSIHWRANSPDCTSLRIFFISARVCSLTTRGPRV